MVTNIRCKEVCHGCSKNILKHNLIVICRECQKICHAKCAESVNLIDMINTLSLIEIAFQKFIKLKIYLKIVVDMTYMN